METIVFFQTGQPVIARRKLAGVAAHARKAGWRVVAAEKTTRPAGRAARSRAPGAAGAARAWRGPRAAGGWGRGASFSMWSRRQTTCGS